MNTYTVTAVGDTVKDWQSKSGAAYKSYRVTLRNKDGRELPNVELSRNASAPRPEAGQAVEGTVDQSGQYGPKFKEDRKGGGGFNRAKSPEERRSIAMQSSLARAVDVVRIAVDAGVFKPEGPDSLVDAVLAASDRCFERVMKAEAGS